MRPWMLMACALAVSASSAGCLSEGLGLESALDCSVDHQQALGQSAALLVSEDLDGIVGDNPSVTVHARAGQTLLAQVTWQSDGPSKVVFDGPQDLGIITTETPGTWQFIGHARSGNVTLGIAGDPLAFGAVYTLQLTASGCTPFE